MFAPALRRATRNLLVCTFDHTSSPIEIPFLRPSLTSFVHKLTTFTHLSMMPVPTASTETIETVSLIKSALPTMSEKEKASLSYNTTNFKPFTREKFAKATYGSNKYWFAKYYGLKWGQSFAGKFLDQAARYLSMKADDGGRKEADQLLDAMRNDPEYYTEEMLKEACGGACKTDVKVERSDTKIGRSRATSNTLKENIAPYINSRITSSRFDGYDDNSRDSDENFRSDGIIVETPAEARGIEDAVEYSNPPERATHEDGNYNPSSNSRLSTVCGESSGGKGGKTSFPLRGREICVDADSDDDDDYDDEDDYHDMMGHEFGKEAFYDDYRGEFDGSLQ